MTAKNKQKIWTGRRRILAAFDHQPVDQVPRFDQTVSSNVASAVLDRELLVGGGSLRFAEVEARFRGPEAAADFEERLLEDVVCFFRSLYYDMARMPWRDTRLAERKLDTPIFSVIRADRGLGKSAAMSLNRTTGTLWTAGWQAEMWTGCAST